MKVYIAVLIIATTINIFQQFKEESQVEVSMECPELEDKDIFIVSYFLTQNDLNQKTKVNFVKTYEFNNDEIGELDVDTISKVKSYWENQGIQLVTDKSTCSKIQHSISSTNTFVNFSEEFRLIFYRIEDKYAVFYLRKESKTGHGSWPVQLLNDNFELINDLKLE